MIVLFVVRPFDLKLPVLKKYSGKPCGSSIKTLSLQRNGNAIAKRNRGEIKWTH